MPREPIANKIARFRTYSMTEQDIDWAIPILERYETHCQSVSKYQQSLKRKPIQYDNRIIIKYLDRGVQENHILLTPTRAFLLCNSVPVCVYNRESQLYYSPQQRELEPFDIKSIKLFASRGPNDIAKTDITALAIAYNRASDEFKEDIVYVNYNTHKHIEKRIFWDINYY